MSATKESLPARILSGLTASGRHATFAFAGPATETLDGAVMARRIAGAGRRLKDAGLGPGRVVPILCPSSADLWSAFSGAMAADLVPANLSLPTFKTHLPTYRRNLEALMERYDTDAVIGSLEVRERLADHLTRPVRWIDIAHLREEASVGSAPDPSSPVAFLQHSSGSTGVPRGVALTHQAVLDHLGSYAEAIHLDPGRDLIASWLPLYHDMGLVTSFLLPLVEGVSCRSMTPEQFITDPLGFVRDMGAARATLSWWPNFAFALLSDRRLVAEREGASALDLSALRGLVNCSEVVMASSMDRFAAAFSRDALSSASLQASYAMAENVFAVTQTVGKPARLQVDAADLEPGRNPVAGAPRKTPGRTLVSSGRSIREVKVRIVDVERRELADGVVGEIAIAGPFLFSEYLELKSETASCRAGDWYFTRDFGFRWQGELYVLGRAADLIVVGGRKFLANEIERVAGEVAGVKPGRAVAFGVRSESLGTENAVAMVESAEAADPSRARAIRRAITQSVLQQLDLSLAEVRVVAEGSLIKTSSGKIARNDNRLAYLRAAGMTPS